MDLKTVFNNENRCGDLSYDGLLFETETGLETAILHSLFTDRRATEEDVILYDLPDRRGWWGDLTLSDSNDQYGSRLWLLSREKQTPKVLARAEEYAHEALEWLLVDKIATDIEINAEIIRPGICGLSIHIFSVNMDNYKGKYEVPYGV